MYDHWFSFSLTAFGGLNYVTLAVEDTVVQVGLIDVYVGDLACLI